MKNLKTTTKSPAKAGSSANQPKKTAKRKANAVEDTNKPLTDDERKAKKIKLKKQLNKIASVDELNQLQASEKLYHSNFFHLQIDELLKEVKLKPKYEVFVNEWISQLTEFVATIDEDTAKVPPTELRWLKNKSVVPPIGDDTPWAKSDYFFQFLHPKAITAIGSLRTLTVIGSNPVLDVCLEIPSEFFQKNNHLNGIYHQKRALYLSYIALKLKEWEQVDGCEFAFVRGDPLRPVVRVKPAGKYGKHLTIDLHAVCSEESFKLERFLPDKSNVKQLKKSGQSNKAKNEEIVKNDTHTATPHYNASILRDLTTVFNEEFLANSIETANVRDAIVLLKVWLRQRGLDTGFGGISGYVITAFVVYLLQKNRINVSMNSYQILRQIWIAFGE